LDLELFLVVAVSAGADASAVSAFFDFDDFLVVDVSAG